MSQLCQHYMNPFQSQILSDELIKRYVAGAPKTPDQATIAFVGHTRYPTSSRSIESELHPHVWTEHKQVRFPLILKSIICKYI